MKNLGYAARSLRQFERLEERLGVLPFTKDWRADRPPPGKAARHGARRGTSSASCPFSISMSRPGSLSGPTSTVVSSMNFAVFALEPVADAVEQLAAVLGLGRGLGEVGVARPCTRCRRSRRRSRCTPSGRRSRSWRSRFDSFGLPGKRTEKRPSGRRVLLTPRCAAKGAAQDSDRRAPAHERFTSSPRRRPGTCRPTRT